MTTRLPGWAGTRRNIHPLTHPDHWTSFINFLHLLRSITSSLFIYMLGPFTCSLFRQPLSRSSFGLEPCTLYSMHFFTQSSSFRNICLYRSSLVCCSTNVMSSVPNFFLSSLLGNLSFALTPHIRLTILISARWSATSTTKGTYK